MSRFKTGMEREHRKFKKARLIGEAKTMARQIVNQKLLIEALNQELVRVMYDRAATGLTQAAVLAVVKKRAGHVFGDLEVGLQTHIADAEMARRQSPLWVEDSDIIVVGV